MAHAQRHTGDKDRQPHQGCQEEQDGTQQNDADSTMARTFIMGTQRASWQGLIRLAFDVGRLFR
jgi:hypothetical protein